jgi:hypothetical protein
MRKENDMRKNLLVSLVATPLLLLAAAAALDARSKPAERFRAFAASLGTGRSAIVDILITRWSTDEERDSLLAALQDGGQNRLLDALTRVRPAVGNIRLAGQLGWSLYFARNNVQPDGSRHITMATNRSVAWAEIANATRSRDFQFTFIELHLEKDGNGVGKIVPAARVLWNKDTKTIEIENFNALPVDLLQVRVQP